MNLNHFDKDITRVQIAAIVYRYLARVPGLFGAEDEQNASSHVFELFVSFQLARALVQLWKIHRKKHHVSGPILRA
jgi:hypothetical protein